MSDGEGFDWLRDREDIVVAEQMAIAVYTNPADKVVIRQQNWPEDDHCIIVVPANAPRLCVAILEAAGFTGAELVRCVGGGGYEDISTVPVPRIPNAKVVIDHSADGGPVLDPFAHGAGDKIDRIAAELPKDRTGAERQRRYRQRRNGTTRHTVTVHRDAPESEGQEQALLLPRVEASEVAQ